jgi:hypothetical protein
MEPETEARLMSDHKVIPLRVYRRIGAAFLTLSIVVGAVYAGYMYFAWPQINESQLWQQLQIELADIEANTPPLEFTIVPNATEVLSMPERIVATADELLAEFTAAQAKVAIGADGAEIPTMFMVPVGELTYIDYINELPAELQTPLFQMHDEMTAVTKALGTAYDQTTLAERVGQPDQLAYASSLTEAAHQPLVYPSLRVVEAHFISEVLARQFPSSAAFYRDYANSIITDGVGYGYYTEQEAIMARLLVDNYLNLAAADTSVQQLLSPKE